MASDSPRRVLLVASAGGHLAQLQLLAPCFDGDDRLWATFEHARVDLGDDDVVYCHWPTTRNVPNLVRNLGLAARVLLRRTPDLIVSTGAGAAVPFFVLGRLLGVHTVFLEVYDRIDSKTMTGRLVMPFSDAFLHQWPEQREVYGGGEVVGPVYPILEGRTGDASAPAPPEQGGTVFVTVGTDHHPFDRLVGWADALAAEGPALDVFVQRGTTDVDLDVASEQWIEPDELERRMAQADVVVCHGGPSTIVEAIAHGHRPIVVPRRSEHGEHVDDHQCRFAAHLAERGVIDVVETADEMIGAVRSALAAGRGPRIDVAMPSSTRASVDGVIDRLLSRPRRRQRWLRQRTSR